MSAAIHNVSSTAAPSVSRAVTFALSILLLADACALPSGPITGGSF